MKPVWKRPKNINHLSLKARLYGIWCYLIGKPKSRKVLCYWIVPSAGMVAICRTYSKAMAEQIVLDEKTKGRPVKTVLVGYEAEINQETGEINDNRWQDGMPVSLW
jgi:hypothetical protein